MTDCDALYRAVLAHPDEDTPRLAFADRLDEQGGKENAFRADFVRTHCRLAREEPWSPAWRELNARWQNLHNQAAAGIAEGKLDWVAHLKGRVKAHEFERGFVGHVTVFSKRFVAEGQTFFDADPIRSVKFVTLASASGSVKPAELFACPHLARVAKLSLDGSALKDKDLALLGDSPHLANLRSLSLGFYNRFTKAAAPKLLKALPGLTELSFKENESFKDAHARELARCPELARLTALDLGGTGVRAEGIAAVVGSKHAANLTTLRLAAATFYDDEHGYQVGRHGTRADGLATAEAIAASPHLKNVAELDLNGRSIGNDGLAVLAAAKNLPALRRLVLAECDLTLAGLTALAKTPLGRRLTYLDVMTNTHLVRQGKKVTGLFPDAWVVLPYDWD